MSESECICAKDCPATEHDYPPIEVDETLSELFAEVERLRAVVKAAMEQRDEPCCTEDHCGVCSAVDAYREVQDG